MNEIFYIEDTLTNRISYYLLLAFLVALPFDFFYSEMVLVCLAIHTLIQADWKKPFRIRRSLWLIMSLYAITMLGTLYTSDHAQAWKDWEKQLAFILFPLIFSLTRLDLQKYKLSLFTAFGLSCLITAAYLYFDALRTIRFNGAPWGTLAGSSFMNQNFSRPIGLHATYFSMYIAFSLVVFGYLLIRSRNSRSRCFYALVSLGLLVTLLQLASRAVWVAALILVVTVPFFLMKIAAARKFVLLALPLAALFLFALAQFGSFKGRYVAELRDDLSVSAEEPGIIEPRVVRWAVAGRLIAASPWIGYGTGAEVGILKEKYYEGHLYSSYLNELNAHNEYLSFLLKTGLASLLFFLFLLKTGFSRAIRSKDPFFYAFMVIILCVCFSENVLDTNKGIFFFSFFCSIFYNQ
jgi:O-antigen ligase